MSENSNVGRVFNLTPTNSIHGSDYDILPIAKAEYDLLTTEEKNNGTLYFITDDQGDTDAMYTKMQVDTLVNYLHANLATVESTSTASRAYAVGEYLVYHYQLYRVTAAIAQGGTLMIGTNLAPAIYSSDIRNVLQQKSNHNLLDNSYFIGGGSQQGGGQLPVNQRGQTSYSSAGYTIDRWEMSSYYIGTAELTASGLVLTGGSTANPGIMLWQKFENLPYGTYTLSCLSDGVLGSGTADINSDTDSIDIAVHSTLSVKLIKDSGRWLIWIWIAQTDVAHTIQAIKLELGSEQTLAHKENGVWVLSDPVPNFQQELAKCQRYQLVLPSQTIVGTFDNWANTSGNILIPTPVTLRTNGILKNDVTFRMLNAGSSGYNDITVPSNTHVAVTPGLCTIPFTGNAGVTSGRLFSFDNDIVIDCNL